MRVWEIDDCSIEKLRTLYDWIDNNAWLQGCPFFSFPFLDLDGFGGDSLRHRARQLR